MFIYYPQPGKLDYGSDTMQLYGQQLLDGVHFDSNQKIKLIRLGKLNKDVVRECRCNERDKKTYFQLL